MRLLRVLSSFITGAFVGGFLLHVIHTARNDSKDRAAAEIEAREALFYLKRLRDGRTNDVYETLESRLDGALVTLGSAKKNSTTMRALEDAKKYRQIHPRTPRNATEADEVITKSLSETTQEAPK